MKHLLIFALLLISSALFAQRIPSPLINISHFQINKAPQTSRLLNRQHNHVSGNYALAPKHIKVNEETLKYLLTGYEQEEFDGVQWTPSNQIAFTYDNAGRNTTYTLLNWDGSSWQGESMEAYFYDQNGLLTSQIESQFDGGDWIPSSKNDIMYNAGGQIATIHSYSWDMTLNIWKDLDLDNYTYDAHNNLIEIESFSWDDGTSSWITEFKSNYSYNSNNQPTEEIYYFWSSDMWVTGGHTLYQYNSNGLLSIQDYAYSDGAGGWMNSNRSIYAYNTNNDLSSEVFQNWVNDAWINTFKADYIYDTNGDRANEAFSSWDNITNQWDSYGANEFTYNANFERDDLIFPNLLNEVEVYFNHMILDYTGYEYLISTTYPTERAVFHWTSADVSETTALSDIPELQIFPNPATSQFQIITELPLDDASIALTNLAGQVVLQQSLQGRNSIEVGHLPKGLYLYQVRGAKDSLASGKVVIE